MDSQEQRGDAEQQTEENKTEESERSSPSVGSRGGGLSRRGEQSLDSDRGQTSSADGVVTKVAGLAAGEVAGVHAIGGSGSRAMGAVTQAVGIGDSRTQGVSVEVGEREAAVDLTIVVDYGIISYSANRSGLDVAMSVLSFEWSRGRAEPPIGTAHGNDGVSRGSRVAPRRPHA